MAAFTVNAYKCKGITKAQNTLRRAKKRPDLMYHYHIRSSSTTSNNHIEGELWTNKSFNGNSGFTSTDNLTITVVAGT